MVQLLSKRWPLCWMLIAVLASGSNADIEIDNRNEQQRTTSKLIELHEDNWQLMLKGEWMVEFYAPWCPACKNLAPTYSRFAVAASAYNVNVAKIDVTTSPSLSGRFFVTALPTIYHVKNGEFRQYRSSRDFEALVIYVQHQQWLKSEPLSAWKKPDTIHMSILSYFFKLSHTLKDFNAHLQEEYGLPTWGSYALFAIGTIFVGAALGLLLVCIVDFLYPPKKTLRQSFSEAKEKALRHADVEDIANDEIEDDDEDEQANNDDDDDDNDDNNDDDDENDDDDNEDGEDDYSTSEDEKQSRSESEEPESEKNAKNKNSDKDVAATLVKSAEKSSPSEVRKRKPRKAD